MGGQSRFGQQQGQGGQNQHQGSQQGGYGGYSDQTFLPVQDGPKEKKKFTGRCRLFVGNITPDTTEEEFKDLFKPFGEINECFVKPQALPKYIYLSPPLIFPTTSTELGKKNARCELLQALLHCIEWDRIVTLAGPKAAQVLRYRIYHTPGKHANHNTTFAVQLL
jgi:RNA recognition motif-containing protein